MSLTFTSEDGTGLADANSLIAVSYADDYFALRGNTVWAALSDSDKKKHLVLATDYIEYRYGSRFLSTRLYPLVQALSWPRNLTIRQPVDGGIVVYAPYNYMPDYIDQKVVFPDAVKKAVCEYALISAGATLTSEPVLMNGQVVQRTRERMITLEQEIHYAPGQGGKFLPHPIPDALLAPFMVAGGRVMR